MEGFFRFILIGFLILLLIRVSFRFFAPFIARYLMKWAGKKMQRSFNGFQEYGNQSSTNSTANNASQKPPKSKKVVGEYIDFEELD